MEIKEIRGYEGIYEVDETGTVYKINRRKMALVLKQLKVKGCCLTDITR